MEVILIKDVPGLGFQDEKVIVKDGYGRNYLLKQGKALRFNKENQNYVERKKDELNKKNFLHFQKEFIKNYGLELLK